MSAPTATGRSILITGCSSGIGYSAANILKQRGWDVYPTCRQKKDVDRLRDEGFCAYLLDYQKPETIQAAVEAVLLETGGRLDALFNNGAYALPGAIEDLPVQAFRDQFEANFFGWHDLTCRVIPVMRNQGHGRIVQCSSVLGLIAMKYRGAYNASKYALEGLTDTLRMELDGSGIQVSLIEPGPIESKFNENAMAMFQRELGDPVIERSAFKAAYHRRLNHLKKGGATRFKLGPEAVVDRLIHAIEAKKAKPRYFVTVPTHLMAILRRTLPNRTLDRFLIRAADAEE